MAKPHGLPKSALLRTEKEISAVFSKGQYHALGLMQAKTLPSSSGMTRFMVSVGRRIGHAPRRNQIRRLVKEVMRRHRQRLEVPHDICFFLTRSPEALSYDKVEQDVLALFRRLAAKA